MTREQREEEGKQRKIEAWCHKRGIKPSTVTKTEEESILNFTQNLSDKIDEQTLTEKLKERQKSIPNDVTAW